ncbi:MAG: hypothetical protein WD055_01750 [Candidatus Dependentiae bacterium]
MKSPKNTVVALMFSALTVSSVFAFDDYAPDAFALVNESSSNVVSSVVPASGYWNTAKEYGQSALDVVVSAKDTVVDAAKEHPRIAYGVAGATGLAALGGLSYGAYNKWRNPSNATEVQEEASVVPVVNDSTDVQPGYFARLFNLVQNNKVATSAIALAGAAAAYAGASYFDKLPESCPSTSSLASSVWNMIKPFGDKVTDTVTAGCAYVPAQSGAIVAGEAAAGALALVGGASAYAKYKHDLGVTDQLFIVKDKATDAAKYVRGTIVEHKNISGSIALAVATVGVVGGIEYYLPGTFEKVAGPVKDFAGKAASKTVDIAKAGYAYVPAQTKTVVACEAAVGALALAGVHRKPITNVAKAGYDKVATATKSAAQSVRTRLPWSAKSEATEDSSSMIIDQTPAVVETPVVAQEEAPVAVENPSVVEIAKIPANAAELGQLLKTVKNDDVTLSAELQTHLNEIADINAPRGSQKRIAALILQAAV